MTAAPPPDRPEPPVLETRGIAVEFAGFRAVDGVSLSVGKGSIHALIGPNGAGKTTCFNLITRFLTPTSGRILFNGRDVTAMPPAAIARQGLVRSFQISSIFPGLSVNQNVCIALQSRRRRLFQFWRSDRSLADLAAEADALLDHVGLLDHRDTRAALLSYGRKRALELATTLALDPQVLLLDEPMAGMSPEDVVRITALIQRIRHGRTILMVEHNLSVVAALCDRITVLARGKVLAEGDYRTVAADPRVQEAYIGADHD
ncbi:Lipopolysaccharide export system ATP-binding protein LptB [bacterium YEK0313]|nr:Lipopolysaccharide export system ATP-binding protein LptB [bacterium YEK0313]